MSIKPVTVSVVMPVRNGGVWLAAAVESILQQSLRALELIVVDDHSDDQAIAALDQSDRRLRVVKGVGKGVVATFNQGMALAQGDLIARMDADDIALPERLETQCQYLRQHPEIDIAGGCVELFSSSGLAGGNIHYQSWLNSVQTPQDIARQMFVESPIPNPTAMFRRAALLQLGGYHDSIWPEDYDLFLRANQAGMLLGKPDGVLLQWREHPERLTHTDSRYTRSRFQQAKAHYLVHGRLPDQPLLLWGAGPSGREMFDLLSAEGRQVEGFIEVHPRRIGGLKRGQPVYAMEELARMQDHFVLVAVGARGARAEIRSYLHGLGRLEGKDFLFVA